MKLADLFLKCFMSCKVTKYFVFLAVLAKGEMEPERKETRNKVDEDRKHEYPFNCYESARIGDLVS